MNYDTSLDILKKILSKVSKPNSLKDLEKFKQDIRNLIKEQQSSIPLNIKVIETGVTSYNPDGKIITNLIYYSLPSDKEERALYLMVSFTYKLENNSHLKNFDWKFYPLYI